MDWIWIEYDINVKIDLRILVVWKTTSRKFGRQETHGNMS